MCGRCHLKRCARGCLCEGPAAPTAPRVKRPAPPLTPRSLPERASAAKLAKPGSLSEAQLFAAVGLAPIATDTSPGKVLAALGLPNTAHVATLRGPLADAADYERSRARGEATKAIMATLSAFAPDDPAALFVDVAMRIRERLGIVDPGVRELQRFLLTPEVLTKGQRRVLLVALYRTLPQPVTFRSLRTVVPISKRTFSAVRLAASYDDDAGVQCLLQPVAKRTVRCRDVVIAATVSFLLSCSRHLAFGVKTVKLDDGSHVSMACGRSHGTHCLMM